MSHKGQEAELGFERRLPGSESSCLLPKVTEQGAPRLSGWGGAAASARHLESTCRDSEGQSECLQLSHEPNDQGDLERREEAAAHGRWRVGHLAGPVRTKGEGR